MNEAEAAAADFVRARERLLEVAGRDRALFAQYRDALGYTPIGYIDRLSPEGQLIGRRRRNWWDRCSNFDRALILTAAIVIAGMALWRAL